MLKLIILAGLFLFSTFGFAHGGRLVTKKVCSITSLTTCAHLHFPDYPNTKEVSEFTLHVVPTDENTIVSKVKVKVGDVEVFDIVPSDEENHFEVTNVNFPSIGEWKVTITFEDNGAQQDVIIPILIKE